MDRTDLAIFREMWRDRIAWIGGWDRGMSASRIARQLGLSTSTVSDRLRAWREGGFIRGLKIFPNPELLGARFSSAHVFSVDPAGFEAIEQMLRLLPNLVHALEVESGFWTVWLDDGADAAQRSLALLGTIPGAKVEREIWPLNFPSATRRPLRRDWEMLVLLAHRPDSSPAVLANRLHVSRKAAARRLERLSNDNLVFFHPLTDFSVSPGVVVNLRIHLASEANVTEIWRALEELDPVIVPQGDWVEDRLVTLHPSPGGSAAPYVAMFCYFDSAAQVWERVRRIAKFPGVVRVVPQFLTRVWRGPTCVEATVRAAAGRNGHRVAVP